MFNWDIILLSNTKNLWIKYGRHIDIYSKDQPSKLAITLSFTDIIIVLPCFVILIQLETLFIQTVSKHLHIFFFFQFTLAELAFRSENISPLLDTKSNVFFMSLRSLVLSGQPVFALSHLLNKNLFKIIQRSQSKFDFGIKRNMAFGGGQIKHQSFDYFLVIDFEATCDNGAKLTPQVLIHSGIHIKIIVLFK